MHFITLMCVCISQICDFGLARLRDLNNTMTANVGTVQVRLLPAVLHYIRLYWAVIGLGGVMRSGVECSGEYGGLWRCRRSRKQKKGIEP